MTTSSYVDRSVDLLIFQGTAPEGEKLLHLGFGTGGEVTTGIQKLVQSVLILLMTELGSVPDVPDLGTDFFTAARIGAMRDEASVQSTFMLAAEQVRQKLLFEATANGLPDDETVRSIALQSFQIDKAASKLTLYIRITSAAGTTRNVYLPIPVAIQ